MGRLGDLCIYELSVVKTNACDKYRTQNFMSEFLNTCIEEATKYGFYTSPASHSQLAIGEPAATMTILDSEGYMTSRDTRSQTQHPLRDNLREILNTIYSEGEADVPPLSHTCASLSQQMVIEKPAETNESATDIETRIQALCTQLSQRDSECNELRELVEQASRQVSRLKRNHAFEIRALQKTQRDRDPKSGNSELSTRFAKVVSERDSLVSERISLASENTFLRQALNALVSDRNRIASDYNRIVKLGQSSGTSHVSAHVAPQVLVFSSNRHLSHMTVKRFEPVDLPGLTEQVEDPVHNTTDN